MIQNESILSWKMIWSSRKHPFVMLYIYARLKMQGHRCHLVKDQYATMVFVKNRSLPALRVLVSTLADGFNRMNESDGSVMITDLSSGKTPF